MPDPENMVFVGLGKRVLALDRDTGELLWQWQAGKSGGFTTLLPDVDRLVVSAGGYIYCLDPANGQELWSNPLKGFGTGVAALATLRAKTPDDIIAAAAAAQAAAAAAAAGS